MPDFNGALRSHRPRSPRARPPAPLALPLAAGLLILLANPDPAAAIRPRAGSPQVTTVELAPGVGTLRKIRSHEGRAPRQGVAAQRALETELGADLILSFDRDTGVADWLIPAGTVVPGASASPAAAEQFAAGFIARHLDALAPGANASDFVLVSDETHAGLRTLGYVQHHAGREVIGGQLSLSFRNDALVAVRSQALAHVQLPPAASLAPVAPAAAELEARTWLSHDFADGDPARALVERGAASSSLAILPLIHADGSRSYREVYTTEVRLDSGGGGLWRVWIDARSGQPIARRSLQAHANVDFVSFRRHPYDDRIAFPAASLRVEVDGQTQLTNANGELDLAAASNLWFRAEGPYVAMNNANGGLAEIETMLAPNGGFAWDLGDDPEADAQLASFIHTNTVKQRIRQIDPGFSIVDLETTVTVNISDICNAFAEGNTINFFLAGGGCNNSALISDVVYHEYGHVAHFLGLQPGVGIFDGAVSEGASDYLSATIVDSAQVGVGFFAGTLDPIRDLDPPGSEWNWPDDIGEVHAEGQILGGTLWDLRELLVAKYGYDQGVAKADLIWLGGIQRSVDMPSWYLEALITNDDDGNLQNGTPDACEIDQAFGTHGLSQPIGAELDVDELVQADGSVAIELSYDPGFDPCGEAPTPDATLRFQTRMPETENGPAQIPTVVEMSEIEPGLVRGVIPAPDEFSVTQYDVEVDWGNGSVTQRPQNRADGWYELWTGEVTEIWCADFEDGGADWTLAEGEWSAGPPMGFGGDPDAAWSGTAVAGTVLSQPGTYSPWTSSRLISPSIDVSEFEAVRLHYRRWLNIEDGYWDQAEILVNGEPAWRNLASSFENFATTHHRDREWRFHDVELTPFVDADGKVSLEFSQTSDGGLEFGGWNIDEVCIVGHGAPAGGCGDGYVQEFEQCDDGNLQNGDGCSSGCLVEDDEEPEPEPDLDDDWDPQGRGCGCGVEPGEDGDSPGRGSILAALALAGLGLRRRARARR